MSATLTEKILREHLQDGLASEGSEVGIRIDQTLTQDATGTTAFLLLEAMAIERVATELSVSYVDHNMSQFGPENHNDHLYLQSVSRKLGAYHSRPGNGICHQVHLERFARPGRTLIGSDSHTPTAGGIGMLAMGAGGLDVAVAMGGGAFYISWPKVIGVELTGKLPPWIAAKDLICRLLSILTTKGNVGCVVEYFGPGVASLSVPQRATCTNMGAELGVTTSIFPSDEITKRFLNAQGRGEQYTEMSADVDAQYSRITKKLHSEKSADVIENIKRFGKDTVVTEPDSDGMCEVSFAGISIDLSQIEPLCAAPSSPGNIIPVSEIAGEKVNQVAIGSCTNSSFADLMLVAKILKGRTVHPLVELAIAPGSRQVLGMMTDNGAMSDLIASGARILECGCGPCIGQGFSPAEGTVTLRTFNRNFPGRSGTKGDKSYLVSPETAVAAALTGEVTDPRKLTEKFKIEPPEIDEPQKFKIDDSMVQPPLSPDQTKTAKIIRGSTIVKPPAGNRLPNELRGKVIIKVGDKITTDHIMPAGTLLKFRSNVPEYAKHVFSCFNEEGKKTFAERAGELPSQSPAGIIIAGESYGQGSSREHAALCPMYLGIRVAIAKSIERMHQANLVNFAILPLTFVKADDYDLVSADDELQIDSLTRAIENDETVTVKNLTKNSEFTCTVALAPRQRKILTAGGLLKFTRA